MIKSMTGFGRAELLDEEKKITVEMKSVNHRYLDVNMRMPKKFSIFVGFYPFSFKGVHSEGKGGLIHYL